MQRELSVNQVVGPEGIERTVQDRFLCIVRKQSGNDSCCTARGWIPMRSAKQTCLCMKRLLLRRTESIPYVVDGEGHVEEADILK